MDTTVRNRLKVHYNIVSTLVPEDRIIGVFLYGSQNYGLQTDTSDVDTKALIMPSMDEICSCKKYVKEIKIPTHDEEHEHCEVMDIRHFIDSLKKQNINFCEILFTDFSIINKKYSLLWETLFRSNKELFVHYNQTAAIKSAAWQAINTVKRRPDIGKSWCTAERLLLFIKKYIDGANYADCIAENTKTYLLALKTETIKLSCEKKEDIFGQLDNYSSYTTNEQEEKRKEIEEKIDSSVKSLFEFYFLSTLPHTI